MGDDDVVVPVLVPELGRFDRALEGGREVEHVAGPEAGDGLEVGEREIGDEVVDAGWRIGRERQAIDRQDAGAGRGQTVQQLAGDDPGSAGDQHPLAG